MGIRRSFWMGIRKKGRVGVLDGNKEEGEGRGARWE